MKTRGEWACLLAVVLLAWPFGTAAQAPIASLSVGSASGLPRTSGVAVPVSLASQGGAAVTGLSFDLTFDATRLSVAGVSLGSAAASAEKSLSWNLGLGQPNPGHHLSASIRLPSRTAAWQS